MPGGSTILIACPRVVDRIVGVLWTAGGLLGLSRPCSFDAGGLDASGIHPPGLTTQHSFTTVPSFDTGAAKLSGGGAQSNARAS